MAAFSGKSKPGTSSSKSQEKKEEKAEEISSENPKATKARLAKALHAMGNKK